MSGVSFSKENIWHDVSWFRVLLKLRVFDNEHTHHRETVIAQWCASLNFMIAAFGEPTVSDCEPCACFEYNDACATFSFAREHDECYARFARAARCVAAAKRKVLCDRHAEDVLAREHDESKYLLSKYLLL